MRLLYDVTIVDFHTASTKVEPYFDTVFTQSTFQYIYNAM